MSFAAATQITFQCCCPACDSTYAPNTLQLGAAIQAVQRLPHIIRICTDRYAFAFLRYCVDSFIAQLAALPGQLRPHKLWALGPCGWLPSSALLFLPPRLLLLPCLQEYLHSQNKTIQLAAAMQATQHILNNQVLVILMCFWLACATVLIQSQLLPEQLRPQQSSTIS